MEMMTAPLSRHEEIIYNLRGLYSQYGYNTCRVRTFEKYDFYVHCRSALPGEDVLVFTDADGCLMALKPDVTMSIVKNIRGGTPGLRKLCYNENVYRIPTGGTGFRESVQTGLECIGTLDDYAIGEVLMLAIRSLQSIHAHAILNLTHIGIVDGLLEQAMDQDADRTKIRKAMEQKNLAALEAACREAEMDDKYREKLCTLTGLFGPLKDTLPRVVALAEGSKMLEACQELDRIKKQMAVYGLDSCIHLDFSIQGGTDYYSGLVFRGLVDGISAPVLLGGRYDKLIRRMGKPEGGIGFAVYLDQLEGMKQPDTDPVTLLLYDDQTSPEKIAQAMQTLMARGRRIRAEREIPPECRNARIIRLTEEGVQENAGLY